MSLFVKRALLIVGVLACMAVAFLGTAHAQTSATNYCLKPGGTPASQPCSESNPLFVSPVAGGADQDVNIVGVGGNAVTTTVPVLVGIGATPTDRTVTSATGSSQTVMSANASRRSVVIQNTGNANCGINPTGGTAAIGGAGTLTLLPSGSYQPAIATVAAITAICTAGQPLYAQEN